MLAHWLLLSQAVLAILAVDSGPPTVVLDSATVTGVNNGSVHKFLGIPFASAPVGPLRFQLPHALGPYRANFNATGYGPACIQQRASLPSDLPENVAAFFALNVTPDEESEDCLTINVVRPAFASSKDKLPVVAYIYGGGFTFGSAEFYDGLSNDMVDRSVALGSPVIFVSFNYRLTGGISYRIPPRRKRVNTNTFALLAFGFLASKEVKSAKVGNAGLLDQREALHFLQKYIANFGGDPSRVMIYGSSAGATSVSMQMIANGGDNQGLFSAGFMQSGPPIPVGDLLAGQKYYDIIVNETSCRGRPDTLACLRTVPLEQLRNAIDKTASVYSYQALLLPWAPRADGSFILGPPQRQILQGNVANVPFVTGNVDDEATLFSFSTRNVTTETDFRNFVRTVWFPKTPVSSLLNPIWTYYPSDPSQGSPFDTGTANVITPQYKRIAAYQSDVFYQGPRRFFLQSVESKQGKNKQKVWSYLSKIFKETPNIGSFHGSDIELLDYAINFAVKHDPNNATGLAWPEYTADSPQLLTFEGNYANPTISITQDTYRADAMKYLTTLSLAYPPI